MLPSRSDIEAAAADIYRVLSPTAQISWPLLNARAGCELWIKHENHNPTGAFKVRGGLVYVQRLKAREPGAAGICAATRGNHGQSVGFAAARHQLPSTIVVPEGNSTDKNAAMRALGVNLVIAGEDFDAAVTEAKAVALRDGLHLMPSYHTDLVTGVATYALELFRAVPDLARIYVPIGLGSGISAVLAARNALGLETEVVGVVSANANTYERSLAAGEVVGTSSANTIADGLAVRNADPTALTVLREAAVRIVTVSDAEILAAMGHYFSDTHNVAEGAGAAGLAAVLKEREQNQGERIATVLTGGNVNAGLFREAIAP